MLFVRLPRSNIWLFLLQNASLLPAFSLIDVALFETCVGVACAALTPALPILVEDEVPFCFMMSDALDCNVFRPPVFLLFASVPLEDAWWVYRRSVVP